MTVREGRWLRFKRLEPIRDTLTGFVDRAEGWSRYEPPMGFARLFRSRWAALFWAGGVLWTAYDVVDAAPQPAPVAAKASTVRDATGETFDAKDLAALANAAAD